MIHLILWMKIGGRKSFEKIGINYLGLIWKNNMTSLSSRIVTVGLTLTYARRGLHEDMQPSHMQGDDD